MSVTTINPVDLANLLASGRTLEIIDVRTPMEYQEVHLGAARNIPLNVLQPTQVMEGRGNCKDPVYLVCRSGSRGKQACEKFLAAGFTNVVNIEGGTLACLEHGMHVVRGKKVISLERQVRIAAGSLALLGAILGFFVDPLFIGLSAFVGAGLIFAGITDRCGMGLALAYMPWNTVKADSPKTCCAH